MDSNNEFQENERLTTPSTKNHKILETPSTKNQESPFRVRKILEISRFDIKKPHIEGLDKLPDGPAVIATTHLSDIDVQEVAMAVAGTRKIGVASQETNLTFPLYKPFVEAIGKENFFPITNAPYKSGGTAYSLRIEDLKGMEEGIKKDGRSMIVAGHNPTHNWQLPENPGMAAIILAHIANVPIVPAALDIHSKTPVAQSTDLLPRVKNFLSFRRPSAKIIFGEPIKLTALPEEKLKAAVNLYSPDERRNMTAEQIDDAKQTLTILQDEASQMMESLAAKLPAEKRGKWGQNPTPQPTP